MNVNMNLKAVILESGIKQFVIAGRAGIDPTVFSKILNGHRRPSEEEKIRIAEVVGQSTDKLFRDAVSVDEPHTE